MIESIDNITTKRKVYIMKKIVSLALILCMLVGATFSIGVYAAPSVAGSDSNTSRFYNKQSNTGIDAYPGSAKIDGVWDENDEWSNALPLTLNATTKALITNCGISSAYDGEFYLLWDENGLYVMEIQRQWSGAVTYETAKAGSARPWNAWATQIYVSPNKKFVLNTSTVRGLFVFETATDASGANVSVDTPVKAVITQRDLKYTSWPGAISGTYATPESIDGVTSYFSKTANGAYVMETFMSWEYVGMASPDATTTTDIVDALGVKLGMGKTGGTHLGGLDGATAESTGFDPITLRANVNTVKKAVSPEIIDTVAAEKYWTDEENGQFTINYASDVYEISNAEQLLGLSLAMENNANDKAWTAGKTFKLTADIDLNPGIDWASYKMATLNPSTDIANVSEYYATIQTPTNVWLSLDTFYGVFDGQGHTIKGIWALGAPNGNASATAEWGVFGGRVYRGSAIKNVILDDGYISSSGSGVYGGIVGSFRHSAGTDDTSTLDDGVLFANIYIGENFTIDASANTSKQSGGIVSGGAHEADSSNDVASMLDVTFRNIVFAGHFKGGNYYSSTILGQWSGWFANQRKYNINMTDCVITGMYENTAPNGGAATASQFGGKSLKNCYDFGNEKEQSIEQGLEGRFIKTAKGIMPVAVADMFAKYAYQATSAKDGKYSIRIIGEITSLEYDSVDFKISITRSSDGKSAAWGYGANEYVNAKTVYNSVLANGKSVTAATFNQGFLDDENGKLYVLILNDLDINETYTISVSTVWTLLDGSVIESSTIQTVTPEPWRV